MIAIAWAIFFAGKIYISTLDLSRWGTDLDVLERLQIDAYLARHFRPYILGTLVFDGGAVVLLYVTYRRGPVRTFGVFVWIIWLLSAGWHGLNWLVYEIPFL